MKNISLGTVIRTGVWGLMLGGAAGFTLGLLVAPEEGPRTRRRVSYRLERLGQQVADLVDQITSSHTQSDARSTGDALVADAQVRAEQIRHEIDTLLGEVRRSTVQGQAD